MRNRIIIFGAILSLLLTTATSCSLERKLAGEFIQSKDSISVLLIPPDYLFKTNLKTWKIKNKDRLSEGELQVALLDSSLFLKEMDEYLLIERFMLAVEKSLQQYGIEIYPPGQMLDFFENSGEAYQVAVVQMEVEEDVFPYRAEETFYDSVLYYEDFLLEMVSINTWFEISKLNDTVAKHNTLFAGDYVMDGLEGRFATNIFTGDVTFRYNYDPIELEHVFTLSERLGRRYARYIFDFLMNRYIFFSLPEGRQSTTYFTYDPLTGNLSAAGDRRFIFLED